MYKVFVENTALWFQKESNQYLDLPSKFLPHLKKTDFPEFLAFIRDLSQKDLMLSPDIYFDQFFNELEYIEAAGGIVKNPQGEWMFIQRHGKWDLPKGKIEKGETPEQAAIREIEEECGIKGLQLNHFRCATYHCYQLYGNSWLKKTYWYDLTVKKDFSTKPQTEEGITAIQWFNPSELKEVISNTYGSIIDVIYPTSAD